MKIGIDIDDTMADTFDYLMPYVAEFFNIDIKYLKDNNISYSNLPKKMKEQELEFAKKYYDKVIPNTPFKPKVAEYINKIKELGHEIIIITARDKTLYTEEYKTTIEELKNNNIHYDKLICDFDKAKVCKTEKIDLFIDDSIVNCRKVNELGIETILFSSKSNINDKTDLYRVNSWKEIYEKIKNTERDNIISTIEEKDLKQLQQILKDTFNNNISYEKMKNLYNVAKDNKDVHTLGYYIRDNLVGTVTLNISILPTGKTATIWDLAIMEEYRRLGIATKLMNKAEEIAKREDITRIWLFSGFHRKCAHELYRKLGYDENRDKAFVKQIQ